MHLDSTPASRVSFTTDTLHAPIANLNPSHFKETRALAGWAPIPPGTKIINPGNSDWLQIIETIAAKLKTCWTIMSCFHYVINWYNIEIPAPRSTQRLARGAIFKANELWHCNCLWIWTMLITQHQWQNLNFNIFWKFVAIIIWKFVENLLQ